MQIFRLMGLPDKVIAFDELPTRLLEGFDLLPAEGFPRHWKTWMGEIEKTTKIPPERDPLTNQIRRFDPVVEKGSFFYLVDWGLGPCEERWKEVCDFVRRTVDKETRLKEKIEDMAAPLATNKTEGVTLEPEDVPVIKIPIEFQEKGTPESPIQGDIKNEAEGIVKCLEPGCPAEFEGKYAKNALRLHTQKKHKAELVA